MASSQPEEPKLSQRELTPEERAATEAARRRAAGVDPQGMDRSRDTISRESDDEISLADLKKYENQRLADLANADAALGAEIEQLRSEMRGLYRNELMLAMACALLGTLVLLATKEKRKKESIPDAEVVADVQE